MFQELAVGRVSTPTVIYQGQHNLIVVKKIHKLVCLGVGGSITRRWKDIYAMLADEVMDVATLVFVPHNLRGTSDRSLFIIV